MMVFDTNTPKITFVPPMTFTGDLTLAADIAMLGLNGVHEIRLTDSVADALSIKRGSTDMVVFDSSTPEVNFTPQVTFQTKVVAELGIFDVDLILDTTNAAVLQFGGTNALWFDDAALAKVAAAGAGKDVFVEPETGAAGANAGGALDMGGGQGAVGSASLGGAGGALGLHAGVGGAGDGSTNKGGVGGAVNIVAGLAGAPVSTGDGSDGGDVNITAGNATDTSGGTNDGVGGDVSLIPGTSSGNGTGVDGAIRMVFPASHRANTEPGDLPSNGVWVDSDDANTLKWKA